MKKLHVIYAGWGERYQLGTLADDGNDLLFEYSSQALERGLELSPFKLPLRPATYSDFPDHQLRLPGLVSDALPDGWGMLLMDRIFRKQGRDFADVSPLDRLAFIGDRAMGALCFEPPDSEVLTARDVKLLSLAEEVQQVFHDDNEALLLELALLGGSPHGARPKVLLNYDRKNNRMNTSEKGIGTPVLVKFPADSEHKEVCAVEAMYGRIASLCGMRVPVMEYFDLSAKLSAFAIERFDRKGGMRIPMHTAAGAANVNFRVPQLDYVGLLRLTKYITRDSREVLHALERCVFNIVFNNRDDHSKNFSFLMDKGGQWSFSPAYDLTFSEGPRGEHQMDICGEARAPGRKHLLQLAQKAGISVKTAADAIDRIAAASDKVIEFAEEFPIRKETVRKIDKAVRANQARVWQTTKRAERSL